MSRVRTRTPDGGATTNGAAMARSPPLTTISFHHRLTAPSARRRAQRNVGPLRPVTRRAAPVPAGAEAGEHLHHVANQIVGDLAAVEHHQAATVRREGGLDQFGVHPRQPVPVLDHQHGHFRVREQATQLRAGPVHPRAHLSLDPDNRLPGLRCPLGQAGQLSIQVGALVMGGDPSVKTERRSRHRRRRVRSDQHRPLVHSHRWHRQRPLAEPAIRRLGVDPLPTGPLGQVHAAVPSWERLYDQYQSL